MLRSTFSTTTIASSTTMPIASTSPNSVSALIGKPNASISANVPTIDTGTATSGITDARQFCRNTITTSTTSATASSSVVTTASIELCTKRVGVVDDAVLDAFGHVGLRAASIVARTASAAASAFEPGAWNTPIATAGLLLSRLRSAYSAAPSSMRATSRSRVTAPSADVLTTMSPNSCSVWQPAARVDRQLQLGAGRRRLRADHAGRDVRVLLADRVARRRSRRGCATPPCRGSSQTRIE